jgi:uncharacterized protein (TIGR02757 family)
MPPQAELKELLDSLVHRFNIPEFIENDPISIPRSFTRKEDIEISGFLTALIAWGQRPVILRNARQLMERMDDAPFDFILHHSATERRKFSVFCHRTFNGTDAIFFLRALQAIYRSAGGLEGVFTSAYNTNGDLGSAISAVRDTFMSLRCPKRSRKHFADPMRNAAAKRINMFLRWMVRKDSSGVDFGLWVGIPTSALYCPLDLHSGKTARHLGLLDRNQDDWKAVQELTENLSKLDPKDPVRYDFALYGWGLHERYGSI